MSQDKKCISTHTGQSKCLHDSHADTHRGHSNFQPPSCNVVIDAGGVTSACARVPPSGVELISKEWYILWMEHWLTCGICEQPFHA